MKKQFLLLRARWRMLFDFCPNCNSDAPELYECVVCNWNKTDKVNWWREYKGLITAPKSVK